MVVQFKYCWPFKNVPIGIVPIHHHFLAEDHGKCFCVCALFCAIRVIMLESRPTDEPDAKSNLYVLAGHENTYWVWDPPSAKSLWLTFVCRQQWQLLFTAAEADLASWVMSSDTRWDSFYTYCFCSGRSTRSQGQALQVFMRNRLFRWIVTTDRLRFFAQSVACKRSGGKYFQNNETFAWGSSLAVGDTFAEFMF